MLTLLAKGDIIMDYKEIAEELLEVRAKLNREKSQRDINDFGRGELYALSYIALHPPYIYSKNLSRDMSVSSARIAALFNNMENKGLISRMSDESDNRQTIIKITPEGEKILKDKKNELVDSLVKILKNLGEDDATELLRIHKKMLS